MQRPSGTSFTLVQRGSVTSLQQALAIANGLGMRPLAAKCQLDLACILATTGDAVEARRFLNSALDLFGEMGLVADAPKVEQVQKILALRAPIA